MAEATVAAITSRIHGCEEVGCAAIWDSVDKEIVDDTNSSLIEVFADEIGAVGDGPYKALLEWLEDRDLEAIECPTVACPECGTRLSSWHAYVREKRYYRLIPNIPTLPGEITDIPREAMSPADLIEFFRSDSSNSLVHLTKAATVDYITNNIDDTVEQRFLSAQEVLFLILKGRLLRASKGKGIHAPAVCFTEKTLTALKDTLLGSEARVRKERRAIEWAPYGLMFSKAYLRELGVSPVLQLSPTDERALPLGLKHRVVSFSEESDWNHEREWRTGKDIAFDPTVATILVPRFAQIEPFRRALATEGITVQGFLPLFDLFACI